MSSPVFVMTGFLVGFAVQQARSVYVALTGAIRVETLVLAEVKVDAEGAAPAIAPVDRAGTPALPVAATQSRCQPQVVEDADDRQLLLEVTEVEESALARRLVRR